MRIELIDTDCNTPRARFYSDDGHKLFEILVEDTQNALTLRSLHGCVVDGVACTSTLQLAPRSGNAVIAGLQRK